MIKQKQYTLTNVRIKEERTIIYSKKIVYSLNEVRKHLKYLKIDY